jgi:hypothetical protein
VVCHNVSIVDLYSYIVIVKPRKEHKSWGRERQNKTRVHTVNLVVVLHV